MLLFVGSRGARHAILMLICLRTGTYVPVSEACALLEKPVVPGLRRPLAAGSSAKWRCLGVALFWVPESQLITTESGFAFKNVLELILGSESV